MTSISINAKKVQKKHKIGLWFAQILLGLVYLPAGAMKLFAPVAQVAANIPWASSVPAYFLRGIGIVDLAAGLGILLPSILRVYPSLTLVAASGSIALQLCAIVFHTMRGEYVVLPFNLCLIGLAMFVIYASRKIQASTTRNTR